MLWLILGGFCLVGGILLVIPDRKATADVTFIDRSQVRRGGGQLLGLAGTALAGLLVLSLLANWVASDL